jgi:hypothetical protein
VLYICIWAFSLSLSQEGNALDKGVLKELPAQIIASMNKRIDEIESTRSKMANDMTATQLLFTEWETK